MPRADLIVNLVRAGSQGDQGLFRSTVEAMAAEERAKHHNNLADRLEENGRAANARPRAAEVVRSFDGGMAGFCTKSNRVGPCRPCFCLLMC